MFTQVKLDHLVLVSPITTTLVPCPAALIDNLCYLALVCIFKFFSLIASFRYMHPLTDLVSSLLAETLFSGHSVYKA